ncbi:MAG: dihydrofolate reductase [Cytophagaceae bacterium]|nr:dihydrofolate reductase [Cytophagaceae bacterium]
MKKIIYYVASSLDGYIAGPEDDVSKFVESEDGIAQYLKDLKEFQTVIMGRKTYEFGYRFGLKPGQPAYPHMKHYIFSETLELNPCSSQITIVPLSIDRILSLKQEATTDIYLCGGGQLAGWLLDHQLIDRVKIKLNPIILGSGIPLFGNSQTAVISQLEERASYDKGLEILTYTLLYAKASS